MKQYENRKTQVKAETESGKAAQDSVDKEQKEQHLRRLRKREEQRHRWVAVAADSNNSSTPFMQVASVTPQQSTISSAAVVSMTLTPTSGVSLMSPSNTTVSTYMSSPTYQCGKCCKVFESFFSTKHEETECYQDEPQTHLSQVPTAVQDRHLVASAGKNSRPTIGSTWSNLGSVVPASMQTSPVTPQQITRSSTVVVPRPLRPTSGVSLMSPSNTIVSTYMSSPTYQCGKCCKVFESFFPLTKHEETECYQDEPQDHLPQVPTPVQPMDKTLMYVVSDEANSKRNKHQKNNGFRPSLLRKRLDHKYRPDSIPSSHKELENISQEAGLETKAVFNRFQDIHARERTGQ